MAMTHNNELKVCEFLVHNFKFYLLLGVPDHPDRFGIYRPQNLIFEQKGVEKQIKIYWQDKKYNKFIKFTRVGTTKNPPKEWEEWMKK